MCGVFGIFICKGPHPRRKLENRVMGKVWLVFAVEAALFCRGGLKPNPRLMVLVDVFQEVFKLFHGLFLVSVAAYADFGDSHTAGPL
jgi:hypothetical protein